MLSNAPLILREMDHDGIEDSGRRDKREKHKQLWLDGLVPMKFKPNSGDDYAYQQLYEVIVMMNEINYIPNTIYISSKLIESKLNISVNGRRGRYVTIFEMFFQKNYHQYGGTLINVED